MRFAATCLLVATSALVAAPPDAKPVFTGTDLTGWHAVTKDPKADGSKTWSAADGVLKCTGTPTGYLVTDKAYSDYTLTLEWRYPPTDAKRPNSGVLVHVQPGTVFWPHCFEAQLAAGQAGDIWRQFDAAKKLPRLDIDAKRQDAQNERHYTRLPGVTEKPVGEWNALELVCRGGAVRVSVNGTLANEATGGSLTGGAIGLQAEGVPVEFRKITLTTKHTKNTK